MTTHTHDDSSPGEPPATSPAAPFPHVNHPGRHSARRASCWREECRGAWGCYHPVEIVVGVDGWPIYLAAHCHGSLYRPWEMPLERLQALMEGAGM